MLTLEKLYESVFEHITDPDFSKLTHGRREGELYGFGAGVGMGKSVFEHITDRDFVRFIEEPEEIELLSEKDCKVLSKTEKKREAA